MFAIIKVKKHVVKQEPSVRFLTINGECELVKGERVGLMVLRDLEDNLYYAIKKKAEGLIIFKQSTFGSFNNFLGAF